MNCNRWNSVVRSHKTNNINEGTNNKIKFSKICKNRTHFDCGTRFNDDISYHSVDLDASSSDPDLDNCFLSKYCKSNKTGSVNKISLRRDQVKSAPCIHSDYDIVVNKGENKPETQKRRFKSKFCLQHFDHGIDYVPIKLISSELDLKLDAKMNKSRQNYVSPKLTERKVNSWGRILKEQNVKDQKKPVEVVQQVSRLQRAAGLGTRSQTQSNIKGKEKTVSYETKKKTGYGEPKERTESYESCTQQKNIKGMVSKRPSNVSIDSDPRGYRSTSKKSSRNIRTESGHRECDYSDSSSTITGESIMLVDRSAQCSETNLDVSSPGVHRNVDDINQAGDNGLAFLNPVRTLNFLVRELRGKLNEGSEDENMLRIIRDMETTVSRLSKTSPQYTKDNWNTIISEEDLKCVLDILQSMPSKTKFVMEAEKSTVELQCKLEETCNRLEEMCKQMEKTTCSKLREEKQLLINELKEIKSELEISRNKISEQEIMVVDLKKKNDEQMKSIVMLKDSQTKSSALNAILNEQLEDTEKKYRQLVTEMQFLMLEKEKNLVLMKCKDQDLTDMRKNLEEIKTLVIQHLSTIHLESTDSGVTLPAKCPNIDFNDLSPVSAVSLATIQNNEDKQNSPDLAKCSSPVEKLSPQPEDDESWRKISDVPTNSEAQLSASEQKKAMKSICLKESLKNLFDEMKKQAHFGKHLPIQNFLNLDDPCGVSNWSDVDISDDDIRSAKFTISDTETNFQDRF